MGLFYFLLDKILYNLERDGVDDALSLAVLQTRLDHVEVGRVNAEGNLGTGKIRQT